MNLSSIYLAMRLLYPDGDHVRDAQAIGLEIARSDASPYEAALLVETAFRESGFDAAAVSPDGRDRCAYQLRDAPRAVLVDLRRCTEIALERIRYSIAHCPAHPIAIYATGSCSYPAGIRLDLWRMREVRKILQVLQ